MRAALPKVLAGTFLATTATACQWAFPLGSLDAVQDAGGNSPMDGARDGTLGAESGADSAPDRAAEGAASPDGGSQDGGLHDAGAPLGVPCPNDPCDASAGYFCCATFSAGRFTPGCRPPGDLCADAMAVNCYTSDQCGVGQTCCVHANNGKNPYVGSTSCTKEACELRNTLCGNASGEAGVCSGGATCAEFAHLPYFLTCQ